MTEQTPMTEDRLNELETNSKLSVHYGSMSEGTRESVVAPLIAEIRRLREENERLEKIASHYQELETDYLMKIDKLDQELNGTEHKHGYKGMFQSCNSHVAELNSKLETLEKQNAELVEVLRHANSYISNGYDLGYIDDREGYTDHTLSMIEKILRKYGLEGTE